MDKNLSRDMRLGVTKWNNKRTVYRCVDGVDTQILKRICRRYKGYSDDTGYLTDANEIRYEVHTKRKIVQFFVSEIGFNRNMSRIVSGAKDIRTIIFPNTVKEVSAGVFRNTVLLSVVLNEGLETLGECQDECQEECYDGVFHATRLREVKLPSTLQTLGDETFSDCKDLRKATFEKGSKLKIIGVDAFYGCTSFRNIVLPEGLEIISGYAFG